MEEAFFLHHTLKCLRIMDLDDRELQTEDILKKFCSVKPDFIIKYVAYVFLRSKNWIVKSGLKFGGDFCKFIYVHRIHIFTKCIFFTVLYKVGPRFYHAKFVVLVRNAIQPEHTQTHYIHGHTRISESSKKVFSLYFTNNCFIIILLPVLYVIYRTFCYSKLVIRQIYLKVLLLRSSNC